jgi:hypothetical protein
LHVTRMVAAWAWAASIVIVTPTARTFRTKERDLVSSVEVEDAARSSRAQKSGLDPRKYVQPSSRHESSSMTLHGHAVVITLSRRHRPLSTEHIAAE